MALTQHVQARFRCGQLVLAPKSRYSFTTSRSDTRILSTPSHGDWGDVSPLRWRENDSALLNGYTLRSSYELSPRWVLEIITEGDRSRPLSRSYPSIDLDLTHPLLNPRGRLSTSRTSLFSFSNFPQGRHHYANYCLNRGPVEEPDGDASAVTTSTSLSLS